MGLMFADDISLQIVLGIAWVVGLILSEIDQSRIIPENILKTFYSTFFARIKSKK